MFLVAFNPRPLVFLRPRGAKSANGAIEPIPCSIAAIGDSPSASLPVQFYGRDKMVEIKYLAQVDPDKCIGCAKCANVCPTVAIEINDGVAEVDERKCLACQNCTGICPTGAMTKILRPKSMKLGVNYQEVDQEKILELCRKAKLHPMQWICLCTATRVREAAAAVLKGARTPEEIALMTGIRSGCTAYCLMFSVRLLEAHGIEVKQPEGYRWYKTTQTIWDVPEELVKKYPGYYLVEDRDVFRKF